MKFLKKISPVVLSLLLIVAGIAHFMKFTFFRAMMPEFLPFPNVLVYVTGVLELILALLILMPSTRKIGALFTTLLFVSYLIVHVNMAINPSYYKGTEADFPIVGAWIRLILQFPLIAWTWWLGKD